MANVMDNILFPIEMLGWSVEEYLKEANRSIELVGLRGFEQARPMSFPLACSRRLDLPSGLIYDLSYS